MLTSWSPPRLQRLIDRLCEDPLEGLKKGEAALCDTLGGEWQHNGDTEGSEGPTVGRRSVGPTLRPQTERRAARPTSPLPYRSTTLLSHRLDRIEPGQPFV